jgi:hypothetical protein
MQIGGVNSLREAARWGETPIIKKKAVEASKNAMTDDFVKKLQELARRDAQKGGGMSQEAINLCHAQMGKYVSPDRSAPIAQMSQELKKAAQEHKEEQDPTLEFLDRMIAQLKGKGRPERIVKSFSGLAGGCSGDLHSTSENQIATVYSPDGEEIAQYASDGGWMNLTTKAENQFLGDSNDVYMQAWDAARAEIKNGAQKQPVACEGETATFDVRA